MYELLTVSMNKNYNKATGLRYQPTEEELEEKGISHVKDWPYTFDIAEKDLKKIGILVEKSRTTVPSTFASKWENPIINSGGNRAVDWLDIFLYMVPTLFIPAMTNVEAKKALLYLSKCSAAVLKWEIKNVDLLRFQQ